MSEVSWQIAVVIADAHRATEVASRLRDPRFVVDFVETRDPLPRLRNGGYHAILLEHQRPGPRGLTLCNRIRALSLPASVVLIDVGDLSQDAVDQHKEQHGTATEYLRGWLEPDELTGLLVQALEAVTEGPRPATQPPAAIEGNLDLPEPGSQLPEMADADPFDVGSDRRIQILRQRLKVQEEELRRVERSWRDREESGRKAESLLR